VGSWGEQLSVPEATQVRKKKSQLGSVFFKAKKSPSQRDPAAAHEERGAVIFAVSVSMKFGE
jgi:hypothetical protein